MGDGTSGVTATCGNNPLGTRRPWLGICLAAESEPCQLLWNDVTCEEREVTVRTVALRLDTAARND